MPTVDSKPVADVVADLLAQMRDAKDDVVVPARRELLELPIDERAARHVEHRLRHRQRPRLHPRREATREDRDLHCVAIADRGSA